MYLHYIALLHPEAKPGRQDVLVLPKIENK